MDMDKKTLRDTYTLGIDTGGTYTDSVIIRNKDRKLICKSKALTTKEHLIIGISQSIERLGFNAKDQITSVSLSTTLATNAIVEKKGCKVGLVLIGKKPDGALSAERIHQIDGRLDLHGNILYHIDPTEVAQVAEDLREKVDAIAISGYLSVRNPAHELEVRTLLRKQLSLPIFCAHELSGNLGYYERTVTAILNASLIAIIGDFISSVHKALAAHSISAPIMIVKGDGTLMQESMALERPVDTVLSGPSASIIGASILTKELNAIIYDMGGTTSDIAILEKGKVYINPKGATVDCWQTHIRAANIYTFGIGGDSFIRLDADGMLQIGPERVEPLCVSSSKNPEVLPVLLKMLNQGKATLPLYYLSGKSTHGIRMSESDWKVFEAISKPCTEEEICLFTEQEGLTSSLNYLAIKGLIIKTGLTPTDIKHVKRSYLDWDHRASDIGVEILAKSAGINTYDFITMCESEVKHKVMQLCQESILSYYGQNPPDGFPIIGIGAPAAAWLPPAADELGMKLILSENSDVANAIGAALCPISEFAEAIIRFHKERSIYTLFLPDQRIEFEDLESAESYAYRNLGKYAEEKARRAGGIHVEVVITTDSRYIDGNFIQSSIVATATDQRLGAVVHQDKPIY